MMDVPGIRRLQGRPFPIVNKKPALLDASVPRSKITVHDAAPDIHPGKFPASLGKRPRSQGLPQSIHLRFNLAPASGHLFEEEVPWFGHAPHAPEGFQKFLMRWAKLCRPPLGRTSRLKENVTISPNSGVEQFRNIRAQLAKASEMLESFRFVAQTFRCRLRQREFDITDDLAVKTHDLYGQLAEKAGSADRQGEDRPGLPGNFIDQVLER